MERQVGEKFEYQGVTLEVVESGKCKGCYFFKTDYHTYCEVYGNETVGPCGPFNRGDGKSVIFKEVE